MNYRNSLAALAIIALVVLATGCADESRQPMATPPPATAYPNDDTLRLNQVQVLGTHNSYHVDRVQDGETPLIEMFQANLIYELFRVAIFNYRQPTLTAQLDAGVRQLELDVWADPAGGAWATAPLLLANHPAFTFGVPELDLPGLKVFHVAQIDQKTNCYSLVSCLTEIRDWSDAHPGHAPLTVMIEIKDEDPFGTAPGLPLWVAADYDALDAEILSVFPLERIVTPDLVQGSAATLKEAILLNGWPTLAQARGKVLFTNCACLTDRHATDYLQPDGSLAGRVMFPNMASGVSDADTVPDTAAFFVFDDVAGNEALITALVDRGYLVRTRADENMQEAASDDVTRRDLAFASGAQFVSTDFIAPDPVFSATYSVSVPGGTPARCNPVSAPGTCVASDIEDPAALAP